MHATYTILLYMVEINKTHLVQPDIASYMYGIGIWLLIVSPPPPTTVSIRFMWIKGLCVWHNHHNHISILSAQSVICYLLGEILCEVKVHT